MRALGFIRSTLASYSSRHARTHRLFFSSSSWHFKSPLLQAMPRGGFQSRGGSGRGRGRGGGGGGARGRAGGSGRGEQRWWDPVWRAEKLRQIRGDGPREEVLNADEWLSKFEDLKQAQDQEEILIKTNFGRTGAATLEEMASELGLYFHSYNKGRNTVIAVSKVPLPNYRADLDEMHGSYQRQISMPTDTESRVENMLAQVSYKMPFKHVEQQDQGNAKFLDGLPVKLGDQLQKDSCTTSILDLEADQENSRLREKQLYFQSSPAAKSHLEFRKKLPTFKLKTEILQAIGKNQVLIVSGETGCGKTTQLPQYILEKEIEAGRGTNCNIICTQPRRISTISVAARVAAERGEILGETVGYQIRLESKRSKHTRLLFCTTGVLLRKLVQDSELKGVSHVIVDEIHERGMNEDFLLIIVRDLLPQRPDIHVILMSATINAESFSTYFGNSPMIHIPGFTFPVKELFLEDVLEITRHVIINEESSASGSRHGAKRKFLEKSKDVLMEIFEEVDIPSQYRTYSRHTQESLQVWNGEKIDLNLVESTIKHICLHEGDGAVLVFLTGWDDIAKLMEKLKEDQLLGNTSRFLLLPLHGSMPTINQKEIFQRPPRGTRKIVLATNIAETSITIDDVVYVIDCGKAKETSYDALNKLACLSPSWISQASARQRRGRAGRVQAGVCYHLFPKILHQSMPMYHLPEILRTPLEELCLQIKTLRLGNIANFLSKALQPPEVLAVQNAVNLLKTIGALNEEEELTSLGSHLATLPLDPKLGKMLVMGAVFQCVDPVLTIAASLAHRDPFVLPIDRKEDADEAKRRFAGDSQSDHIALVRAFEGYQASKHQGRERSFCWNNFLSLSTLQMIEDMRLQFLDLLSDIGFINKSNSPQIYNRYSKDLVMVRAVVCAGLFPSVVLCKQRGKRTQFFTKEDGKVDPHPSSVNARVNHFRFPYLVYSEKVKTTCIYIRDSTNVSDYALLMFGGTITPTSEGGVHMLHGYLQFSASPKVIQLVHELRRQLNLLLQKKIHDPQFDFHLEGKQEVDAVLELLHSDNGY